jgi:hypothetical protein
MNNEIGRKITSLTLMTIMLAAGFSAFAPSTMPEAAAANANLFVSAENSQFQNYFAGPMVIEVVVIDSDIKDTDEAKGEPDVTVNGNKLRMVQATDGNWYGYFADRNQAQIADQTVVGFTAGNGLDFGSFCANDDGDDILGPSMTQTVGFAVAVGAAGITGETQGTTTIVSEQCSALIVGAADANNVVRENKTVNRGVPASIGQIGLTSAAANAAWPFIQLYNFNPTGNVVVQYNKGGGVQSTTLKFDTVDQFAKLDLDRPTYPRGAQVHATITDLQLNIDPTDEDSWTFQTNSTNKTTAYQVFNENGGTAGDIAGGTIDITSSLGQLMFEDNGILILNVDSQGAGSNIVNIQDNADNQISYTSGTSAQDARTTGSFQSGRNTINTTPITITESAPNSSIFGTYDENDVSTIEIEALAPRGKSASIDYNETPKSIVVGFGFASVDIKPVDAEWNSGEEIPVSTTDSDANKNSRADEDLDLFNADVALLPSLRIGTPFTLGNNGTETTNSIVVGTFAQVGQKAQIAGHSNPVNPGSPFGLLNKLNLTSHATNGPIALTFNSTHPVTVNKFSDRAVVTANTTSTDYRVDVLVIDLGSTADELKLTLRDTRSTTTGRLHGFNFFNYDIRGVNSTISPSEVDTWLLSTDSGNRILVAGNSKARQAHVVNATSLGNNTGAQGLININNTSTLTKLFTTTTGALSTDSNRLGLLFNFTLKRDLGGDAQVNYGIVADFFSFGYFNDGLTKPDRVNNMIVRIEAEETGDNTSVFDGSLEFVTLNQLNILDASTYAGLTTVADDPSFIVHQDLDDEEAPRVNYNDLGADGVVTQVADQEDAPTHSGVVSFDKPTYKTADTVVVTLEDQDLNVDVDLIDIFTVVSTVTDGSFDTVGKAGLPILSNGDALGRLLDITFDDLTWKTPLLAAQGGSVDTQACKNLLGNVTTDTGLGATGFTLIETGTSSGIFTGDFQVPPQFCRPADSQTGAVAAASPSIVNGLDMEVNYVDFRDASGQIVEVGDGAGIRANTGSVSLDRTVYPVPWGSIDDYTASGTISGTTPGGRAIFPVHLTGIGTNGIVAAETLGDGKLTIHVQVNDPDFDTSAAGEDRIAQNVTGTARGPVKITVSRDQNSVVLGYAGSTVAKNGLIDVDGDNADFSSMRQLGPIVETSPSSGIFEFDLDVLYTDGPAGTCPNTLDTGAGGYDSLTTPGAKGLQASRFDEANAAGTTDFCILQGDIITVEYTDPADASGDVNTVTDSATFDLRNGALQSDKSVYIIGSDMILTLIEPDFDLDNDLAETYDLDLIEWDSDAATVTMGNLSPTTQFAFDPEPSDLRETGDSTGIFQTVIEIPKVLNSDNLERGEEIVLEYTDWGPSGADFVGQEDEDINLTIFTSNFGATVELDQKVYTWTDKVYITVVAPDHNFDSNLIDEIGESSADPLKVATRGHRLNDYKLVETGTDTGIFTGEVILVGFDHDSNGSDQSGGKPNFALADTGSGPTSGFLGSDDDDGLTVSYEFSEDETVVGSALIRWNIGEVSWLEASYPASGTGVVRVIDPDVNLNPEAVDNFNVDVWSDSDAGGIDLTVTETNEATGIFEGTVFFTTTDDSSGHRLRVAEGDTVTAEYRDETLPDPYTTADELDITATSFIGTVVPPLERAPASNARVVDAFGSTLDEVSVDQQVQITADLTNGQDREQPFAYLVQIQDENGVTVSLAWITGSLSAGQSFSPALSWIPASSGTYTATVFVWESVDNPTALSPPVSVDIDVS